jgi:hypothetical protein
MIFLSHVMIVSIEQAHELDIGVPSVQLGENH